MSLTLLDGLIIAVTLVASLVLGIVCTRRGSASTTEFFVAGRRLSWWLAGTSIVATSFAADTPLAIARIVRTQGLAGNWYWWSGVLGFAACMFFFAPLWRRSGLTTDVEIIGLRYSGRSADGLRVFLALHRSLLVNGITMGWVVLGMQKILGEALGWPRLSIVVVLMVLALVYTASSGLWGVVVTDLFQFVLAMLGSIALMIAALVHFGGPAELVRQALDTARTLSGTELGSPIASAEGLLAPAPSLTLGSLASATFMFYLLVQWWGGAEAGGGGFLVQRLFATRDERHAVLALWWFQIAHFALRTWPWILVGLASIVMFPNLADPELAYPKMMLALLPTGLLGLMVAALFAAFMSTISTHLNWGASYLTTDVYRQFLARDRDDAHYVRFSQACVVVMALLAGVVAWQMDSILGAWVLLMELQAGAVLIGILRWYWWRINAFSEIAALGCSLLISNLLRQLGVITELATAWGWEGFAQLLGRVSFLAEEPWYPARFVINLGVSTAVALIVTWRTRPVERERLRAFFDRVRPSGAWEPITGQRWTGRAAELGPRLAGWLLSTATVYFSLFGLGWLLLGRYVTGAVLTFCAIGCGAFLLGWMRKAGGRFFG